MNICIIGKYFPIQGGVSKDNVWMAYVLVKAGFHVHIVTNAEEVEPQYRCLNWSQFPFSQQEWTGTFMIHTSSKEARRHYIPYANPFVTKLAAIATDVITTYQCDLIYSYYLEPYALAGYLASQWTGVPYGLRHAGSDVGSLFQSSELQTAYRNVIRSADYVIATPATFRSFLHLGVAKEKLYLPSRYSLPTDFFSPDIAPLDVNAFLAWMNETLPSERYYDVFEVITDNYIREPEAREELAFLCTRFPVIPHGVNLSIGSMMPLEKRYLQEIKRISDITKSPYYSEHLCMTRVPGRDIGHLAPLWFTEQTLQQVIDNVLFVQDYLGKPLILENVTYTLEIPLGSMSQTDFFNRLIAATGCGVLLDVTNVFINATNHHFNPSEFLVHMPLDHLVQVHLAGGYWRNGWLVDGHSELVPTEIFDLFQELVSRCQVKGVIFEHDKNFPSIELLLQQMEKAREMIKKTNTLRKINK